MITHPEISTEYHTDELPVAICPGGMKLSTNARSEPANPVEPSIHISAFPFPSLNGLGVVLIL